MEGGTDAPLKPVSGARLAVGIILALLFAAVPVVVMLRYGYAAGLIAAAAVAALWVELAPVPYGSGGTILTTLFSTLVIVSASGVGILSLMALFARMMIGLMQR